MLDTGWEVDVLACRFERGTVDDPFFSRLLNGASLFEGDSLWQKPSTWVPRAIVTGRGLQADRSYDVLLSMAHLTWTHVVALGLRGARRPPWVAYFSDPWSNHPLPKTTPLRRLVERSLERQTLRQADALVFTHDRMRDFILAPYRSAEALYAKSFAIPYFFDAAMYPRRPWKRPAGALVMRHMGNIPVGVYIQRFLEALRLLGSEQPELASRLKVEFYGGHTLEHRSAVRELGLMERVSFHAAVSYPDSLRLMSESDLLLFLGLPPEEFRGLGNATLHLKMADYIGAERPIFAMAGRGSPADDALGRTNGLFGDDDPVRIRVALAGFIADPQVLPPTALHEFSKERVYPLWENVFHHVAGGSALHRARDGSLAQARP